MSNKPIGFFDSGVGGTSVWKEVNQLLPNENTIYLADSKNAPYGEKSKETILKYSIKNTEFLLKKGCKLIVVACNTATTNTISNLRELYNVPFIGIEPAIKPAALQSKNNAVGILATKGTLSSELFAKTTEKFASEITIVEQVGEGLVELIESGQLNSSKTKELLELYIKPMLALETDFIVLGCTHYPYLIPQIKNIVGNRVSIIDSGEAVAKQTKAILQKNYLLNISADKSTHQFYTNTNTEVLKNILGVIPGNTTIEFADF
ncbi:MAG TPA: glutamate racemase [Flavobacteriaceae bacterium]|nr:glutamate racemase [Flavobacteriaceae bacterium]HEX5743234.1 glutamate racemase [Flavobacteriaceae bacterium]